MDSPESAGRIVAMRMLILDINKPACQSLAAVVRGRNPIYEIKLCTSFDEAIDEAGDCDLALVSTELPDDGAYGFIITLVRQEICTPALVIGQQESKAEIVRLIEAGARGYLRREQVKSDLYKHILGALRGEAFIAPEVAGALAARLAELREWYEQAMPPVTPTDTLTRREREVLRLIGHDYSNQDIANDLIIEVGTVKNHVHSILSKLNVSSRREAASYARVIKIRSRIDAQRGWQDAPRKHVYS